MYIYSHTYIIPVIVATHNTNESHSLSTSIFFICLSARFVTEENLTSQLILADKSNA